jgi:hypothetical protein
MLVGLSLLALFEKLKQTVPSLTLKFPRKWEPQTTILFQYKKEKEN